MDSLTHTVLGACLGDAIAGKRIGKKAMLIGALANNLPDIDVISTFWTEPAQELLVHRGITHSILFSLVLSPVLAWAFSKLFKKDEMPFKYWLLLIGSGLFLHILMDAFTSYGTGWFEPFHHHRVTFNTLFIADPFFAFPLLIGTLVLAIMKRTAFQKRKWTAYLALSISFAYLFITILIKSYVNRVIEKDLTTQNIPHSTFMATPTPLNNILWYSIVKSNGNFYVGYYSLFDTEPGIRWEYFSSNDSLLELLKNNRDVDLLRRFSKNYYCIKKVDSLLIFSDMRFGQIGGWYIPQAPFVFNFDLQVKKENRLSLQQGRFKSFNSKDLEILFRRIKGEQEFEGLNPEPIER